MLKSGTTLFITELILPNSYLDLSVPSVLFSGAHPYAGLQLCIILPVPNSQSNSPSRPAKSVHEQDVYHKFDSLTVVSLSSTPKLILQLPGNFPPPHPSPPH